MKSKDRSQLSTSEQGRTKDWNIRTWRNYQQEPGTISTQPSMTKPDEAIPIQTLLARAVMGQPLGLKGGAIYLSGDDEDLDHDQDDMEKLASADLTEIEEKRDRAIEARYRLQEQRSARSKSKDQGKGEDGSNELKKAPEAK